MNIHLTDKKCVACEGGVPALSSEQCTEYSEQVPEWSIAEDEKSISRKFTFKDFKEALAFVDKVGVIAEDEGHHPDMNLFGYKNVLITLSTHAIGGLSENDFIVAAKIDLLQK
ncbi:MAG: 4a-hydroxytetrahydrobiopterin dehydratase [Patescibacteria group bacterium]